MNSDSDSDSEYRSDSEPNIGKSLNTTIIFQETESDEKSEK